MANKITASANSLRLNATKLNELKTQIDTELKRRGGNGSLWGYAFQNGEVLSSSKGLITVEQYKLSEGVEIEDYVHSQVDDYMDVYNVVNQNEHKITIDEYNNKIDEVVT